MTDTDVLARLNSEYDRHRSDINSLYSWLSKRQGVYATDEVARAWLAMITNSYVAACSLHFALHGVLPTDGCLPGIDYVPGAPSYTGKTS